MKVLHVITGLRSGGAENQLALLGRHSQAEQCVVALVNADEIAEEMRADGTEVVELGMRSNRDVLAVLRLARLIRRQRPDVVHVHLYRAILFGRLAARLAGVPVVVTTEHSLVHGTIEGRRATRGVRGLYMATEPFSDATIAVSELVRRNLLAWGVRSEKLHLIPNGVDSRSLRAGAGSRAAVREELGLPPHAQVVGALGRLYWEKRLDLLLRGIAPLLGPDLRLLLVGSGEEEQSLRELARSLGVSDWVHLPGTRQDVPGILAAMDVLASPSADETFGLSVLEAAVVGLPVVYVSAPALEALGPLDGVYHVAADDEALSDGLRTALANPGERPPRESLDIYDIRTVARQVDAFYEGCLQSALRSRRRFRRASRPVED